MRPDTQHACEIARLAARFDGIRAVRPRVLAKLDMETRYAAPTVTRIGYSPREPDETDIAFAAFAATCRLPVLVDGAGNGHAVPAALAAGATVIANELSGAALGGLYRRVSPADRERLTVNLARFASELDIEAGSLGAVSVARVLRYMPPNDIEIGFTRVSSWLAQCGKLFVHDSTPYTPSTAEFVADFEARKAAGERWPGFVADTIAADSHLPPALHVFDGDALAGAATRAGFVVESCRMFTPAALPDFMRLEGRECVELIARKPGRRRPTARRSREC